MRRNKNISHWQELIAKIREWDRREHNWAMSRERMPQNNLVTKTDFIHTLMKIYNIEKRGYKK